MTFNLEMQKALERDGEKLRGLTEQDHGPYFDVDIDAWIEGLSGAPDRTAYICPGCGRIYNKERVMRKHQTRYGHPPIGE